MRKVTMLLAILFFGLQVYAQKLVTGTVTSADDGSTMPGVSVLVKGTTIGTVTDIDGKYSVKVPENGTTLVFSFVGMATQEKPINSDVVNCALSSDEKLVDEVVVVAYGTSKKTAYTGSAVTINQEAIKLRPITNVTNALEGTATGVQVNSASGQPGSGISVRIRGFGSINASSDPLYVVDGVPYSGNISNLNSEDIETITVLKDAASTALYGNRAANGIVMITTKKGNKDRNQINVKITQGYSARAIPEYDRVDPKEYYQLMWEAYRNSLAYRTTNPIPIADANKIASGLFPKNAAGNQVYNGTAYNNIKQLLGYNPFNVADSLIVLPDGTINPDAQLKYGDDLDWAKELQRMGKRTEGNLTVAGGSQRSDYYVSLGYLNDKGFVIKSDFERITGRLNVNTQPKDWLKTGLNISTTISNSQVANDESSTGYVNPFFFSRNMGPIYPVYAHDPISGRYILDQDSNKIYDFGNGNVAGLPNRPGGASAGRHALAETKYNDNLYKRNALSARTYLEFYILDGLKLTTNLTTDISNYNATKFDNKIIGDGAPAGRASKTSSLTTNYSINQLLNYSKTFGKHSIELLLGHENTDYTYNYLYSFRQGIIVDGNTELVNFTTTNSVDSYTDKYRSEGYFTRFNYILDNKYLFSASYRKDGSSKFYSENRFGDFYSVSAAWRLDQESFVNQFKFIDMLKLRTSYGTLGNDGGIGYYAYQALYSIGYNNATEAGFLQSTLSNNNLTWESNNSFDIGLEFGFLNRISGNIEYFHKVTDNLLFSVPLPLSSGMQNIDKNIGTMYNKGIEARIAVDVVKTKDFKWNLDFNFTKVKNEITKLPQKEIISGTKKLMEGHSIYDYWLREWYGVDSADGRALYRANAWDPTNCRVIGNDTVTISQNNAKYHYAGTAIPKFYGGISSTFSYKNFDLSLLFTYQVGGKIYDATWAPLMHSGTYGTALASEMLNRWQKPGDITNVPRMDNANITAFSSASDRFLTDASYLNFKSANLSYNLSKNLASRIAVQSLRVFASVENIKLFTKRKGMNVQQSFTGVTSNAYAPARVFTVGLNVSL